MTSRLSRSERQAQTRQELLDAAARVFVAHGFRGASIERITAEAGYTRGAFYSNFSSKEELFAELLQQRVYANYRRMAEGAAEGERQSFADVGRQLAEIQADPDGRWLFVLWLELLAHAGRDESFRSIARGFWNVTRAGIAEGTRQAYAESGREPPAPPDHLATALIALDIGLALQHFVDPDAVPLSLYPELYELLFRPYAPDTVP